MTFFPLKFYSVEFSIQHASNRLDSSGSSVPGKTKPLHFKGRSHCGFSSKGVFVMEHKIHNRNNHLSMWIDKNSPRLRLIPENSEECSTKKKKKKSAFSWEVKQYLFSLERYRTEHFENEQTYCM